MVFDGVENLAFQGAVAADVDPFFFGSGSPAVMTLDGSLARAIVATFGGEGDSLGGVEALELHAAADQYAGACLIDPDIG